MVLLLLVAIEINMLKMEKYLNDYPFINHMLFKAKILKRYSSYKPLQILFLSSPEPKALGELIG